MANNNLYGYTPKMGNEKDLGPTGRGNRLNYHNPHEFRKGMDYELTAMGCSRLAESLPKEREQATEKVLKHLEEHTAYYSALIQFEGGMNHASPINETSFKKFLESYSPGDPGTNMVEVNKEIKDDKMTEPKPNDLNTIKMKTIQPLKEAIKKEINKLLKEDEEPSKKDVKKAGLTLSKTKDRLVKLKEKKEGLMNKRKSMFDGYKDKIKGLDPDKAKKEFDKYSSKQDPITKEIKDIEKEMKDLEGNLEEAKDDEKNLRREAAKTMMGKDIHMEILNIIKEYGISLREGSESLRPHYEIAKMAYMEGLTAGMKSNI